MLDLPTDVVVARTVRSLIRALLLSCGAVLAVGAVAAAALALAGDASAELAPGLTLVAIGQAGGLAAAVVSGVGLRRVLAPVAPGHDRTKDAAALIRARVAGRLGVVIRAILAACVLAAATWAVVDPGSALVAIVGALVSGQVVVLLIVARRHVAGAAAG